jgi:hypothetical protein
MRRVLLSAACAALLTAACATPAPYGPAMRAGAQGFSEQRIENDRYRITYRSHGDPMRAQDLALRRAAELALANGSDWFTITSGYVDPGRPDANGRPSVSIGAGSSSWGRYRSSGVGVGLGFSFGGGEATTSSIEVRLGRGTRPDDPRAYSARDVLENVGRY